VRTAECLGSFRVSIEHGRRSPARINRAVAIDPATALKNTAAGMEFPHNRREADNSCCALNAGRSGYGCGAPGPGIGAVSPPEEPMEPVPLSFMIAVTLGFVLAGLLNSIADVPPMLIVVLFMGGLAACLEYYLRSNR
jgi:hypothetical protein